MNTAPFPSRFEEIGNKFFRLVKVVDSLNKARLPYLVLQEKETQSYKKGRKNGI